MRNQSVCVWLKTVRDTKRFVVGVLLILLTPALVPRWFTGTSVFYCPWDWRTLFAYVFHRTIEGGHNIRNQLWELLQLFRKKSFHGCERETLFSCYWQPLPSLIQELIARKTIATWSYPFFDPALLLSRASFQRPRDARDRGAVTYWPQFGGNSQLWERPRRQVAARVRVSSVRRRRDRSEICRVNQHLC